MRAWLQGRWGGGGRVQQRGLRAAHTRPEDGRGAGTLLQRGSEGRPEVGALGPPAAQRMEAGATALAQEMMGAGWGVLGKG